VSIFRTNPRPEKDGENSRLGETTAAPRPEFATRESPAPRAEIVTEPRATTQEAARPFQPPPPPPEREIRPEREVRASATDPDKCANVIAAGSKWSGTLNIEDSVRIDGQLTGEVVAKGTVHIAEGARVDAKIRAGFVVISGTFKGEVRCNERLELMPKSRVEGDLFTKVLNVHEGALVDGNIQMASERNAKAADEALSAEPERPSRSRAAASSA
jgi:cytoskeletal protein CcmA (bactofilin family)